MSFPDFLTMAFDLVDALGGKNHKDNSNVKFLSPRFAPLMPDKVPLLFTYSKILFRLSQCAIFMLTPSIILQ
uniref:Secreted protein n=1 Tax=Ascaris lumbricoides TaxID=6252 RepID=A0A0M3IJH5_ASCLU